MTIQPQRRDAARNRQHVIDTARRFIDEGVPLRLNDVARAASIGVATVYRHFPTPEALLEALARPGLEHLVAVADRALGRDDTWAAFTAFLTAGIETQLADASIQPVISFTTYSLPETAALVERLDTATGTLLDRAQADGIVLADLTPKDIVRLMCGVVFASSVHAGTDERAALTRRYLKITLAGIRRAGR